MLEFSHFPYLLDEVNVSNAPHPATNSLRSKRFRASLARKLRREQRKGMTGYGEEREGNSVSFFPLPFPLPFCFFAPALTFAHLETLATQATLPKMEPSCIIGHVLYIGEWQKRGGVGTSLRPKQSILLPRLCGPKSFQDQPLLSKTSQRMIDIFIFSFQEDLFAKSTFFLLAFSHKKCGTDPVAHHHYPQKEVLPRTENPS